MEGVATGKSRCVIGFDNRVVHTPIYEGSLLLSYIYQFMLDQPRSNGKAPARPDPALPYRLRATLVVTTFFFSSTAETPWSG
jgi:hypothetical protein